MTSEMTVVTRFRVTYKIRILYLWRECDFFYEGKIRLVKYTGDTD